MGMCIWHRSNLERETQTGSRTRTRTRTLKNRQAGTLHTLPTHALVICMQWALSLLSYLPLLSSYLHSFLPLPTSFALGPLSHSLLLCQGASSPAIKELAVRGRATCIAVTWNKLFYQTTTLLYNPPLIPLLSTVVPYFLHIYLPRRFADMTDSSTPPTPEEVPSLSNRSKLLTRSL